MGNIFTFTSGIRNDQGQGKQSEEIDAKKTWRNALFVQKIFAADHGNNEDDDLEDPVERMLKKTGCLEQHYSVQECIAETKDWRQCQKQVQDFKECMKQHKKRASKIWI